MIVYCYAITIKMYTYGVIYIICFIEMYFECDRQCKASYAEEIRYWLLPLLVNIYTGVNTLFYNMFDTFYRRI